QRTSRGTKNQHQQRNKERTSRGTKNQHQQRRDESKEPALCVWLKK
ncbi:hypothetical protein Gotri_011394, partial [Gossypium trilobum]|nr:hypothetical protein [Gossypium trilobum]